VNETRIKVLVIVAVIMQLVAGGTVAWLLVANVGGC
jgi:hypothetical protein